VIEAFRDEEPRQAFYRFFEEVQETYEILSPDSFLRPYLDDYTRLVSIFEVCRSGYDRGLDVDRTFLRKTGELVRRHTQSARPLAPKQVFELSESALTELAEADSPAAVKVINLLKTLRETVRRSSIEQPFLIAIGERAEEIARAFEERQIDSEQALIDLLAVAQEAATAKKAQVATGLSPDAFAVLWYLKGKGLPEAEAEALARAAADTFLEHPHWRTSADHSREVRLGLYKAFIVAGRRDQSTEYVTDLLDKLARSA
jgi:type I restriction enzyme R subunit